MSWGGNTGCAGACAILVSTELVNMLLMACEDEHGVCPITAPALVLLPHRFAREKHGQHE